MNQIEKAIRDLSSPNKNTRYEACEELRVADSLPEPAIAALEAATNDPDPLVADAARRALANHSPTEEQPVNPSDLPVQDTTSGKRLFFLVVGSGLFFAILSAFLILGSGIPTPTNEIYRSSGCCGTELGFIIFTPLLGFGVLALGGIAAYAITKGLHLKTTSSQITVALLTGVILGTLIGVLLHFEIGNFTYVLLALTAIAIASGIVILIRNKKSGGARKGNAIA